MMPELRRDPVIGRWVIISSERGRRPHDFEHPPENQGTVPCPFCPGNEEKTPPEILVYGPEGRPPNTKDWHLRVVPNKYPALRVEGNLHRTEDDLFAKMDGLGAHEVIIETSNHNKSLEDLHENSVQDVFWSYRDRLLDLKKDDRLEYVLVFKNSGRAAGATLTHSHSQLIATPMVPIRVKMEMSGSADYFERKGRCVFCDIIQAEKSKKIRMIEENEHFIAIAPFASRSPFEIWVLPQKHKSEYADIQKSEVIHLAKIMKSVLGKMGQVLDHPAYNFLLHNIPLKTSKSQSYHWHFEIMPTLSLRAGFEWGTGFYINPIPPEQAAEYLKEIE